MVAVLFDLENTLTGSAYQFNITEVRERMKERLIQLGVPGGLLDGLENSLTLMINKAYDYTSSRATPGEFERFRRNVGELLEQYWIRSARESYLMPGAVEALEEINGAGYSLGLVSNASRLDVNIALEKHGLSRFFDAVVTSDEMKLLKPEPEGLLIALRKLGEEELVFVGDSIYDLEAAKRVGGQAIMVQPYADRSKDWQPSVQLIEEAGAHLARSLFEVPGLVKQLFPLNRRV